jgi:hypothetical protein
MTRPRSRFSRFVAIALVIFFLPIFALATTVAATGVVTVEVHEQGADGVDLYIPVPALLFDVAVWAAPKVIPPEELADMRREVAPYRNGLEALAAELEKCPSGVLVEVESPGEHVRIVKTKRSFEIEVRSPDANVSVSVPARLLGRALDLVG